MESHGLWGLLESLIETLPLKVLGEKLSITHPAVVGLQATSFSVKRRPKDSKPQTEAHKAPPPGDHSCWGRTHEGRKRAEGPTGGRRIPGAGSWDWGHQPASEAFAAPTESTSMSSCL